MAKVVKSKPHPTAPRSIPSNTLLHVLSGTLPVQTTKNPDPKRPGSGTEFIVSGLAEQQYADGIYYPVLACAGNSSVGVPKVTYYPDNWRGWGGWDAGDETAYYRYVADWIVQNRQNIVGVHIHLSSSEYRLLEMVDFASLGIKVWITLYTRFPLSSAVQKSTYRPSTERWVQIVSTQQYPCVAPTGFAADEAQALMGFNVVDIVEFPISDHFVNMPLVPRRNRTGDFLYVGAMSDGKGADISIRAVVAAGLAIRAVVTAGQKITLAGPVDRDDPRQADYFDNQVEPLIKAYPRQVTYLGPQPPDVVNSLMSHAQALLALYNWTEPSPMTVIQMRAVGGIVVALDRGALSDLIPQGCGVVLPTQDRFSDDEILMGRQKVSRRAFERHRDQVVNDAANAITQLPQYIASGYIATPQQIRQSVLPQHTNAAFVNAYYQIYSQY